MKYKELTDIGIQWGVLHRTLEVGPSAPEAPASCGLLC